MDLETENRIAAILMREAAELRRRAEREGVHVYLERPKARARPNSRFLTATVLGVQQTNRAVEVNEMWRVRQKELELNDRLRGRSRDDGNSSENHRDGGSVPRSTSKRHCVKESDNSVSSSSIKGSESSYSGDKEGLRDEQVEEFLHSRVKRGRGAVGSRMDDTGPYLPPCPDTEEKLFRSPDAKPQRVVFGPEKPSMLKSYESSEEELDNERLKKAKKVCSKSLDKEHFKKHRSKEKSRDKKRKRKDEKRSRH